MKKRLFVLLLIFSFMLGGLVLAQEFGVKKKRPKPHEFGNVNR